jgi:hypothetical protein
MITNPPEKRSPKYSGRREYDYGRLEKRLDEHTEKVEKRLHRFFSKSLAVFVIIGLTSAIALFGFTITLSKIKQTRKDFVKSSCVAQNKRHDITITKFKAAAKRAEKRSPKFAQEIKSSIKDNLEIIDALAPKQNCEKLSEVAIGEAKPPPPVIVQRGHP